VAGVGSVAEWIAFGLLCWEADAFGLPFRLRMAVGGGSGSGEMSSSEATEEEEGLSVECFNLGAFADIVLN
jgi:hypothetical protein